MLTYAGRAHAVTLARLTFERNSVVITLELLSRGPGRVPVESITHRGQTRTRGRAPIGVRSPAHVAVVRGRERLINGTRSAAKHGGLLVAYGCADEQTRLPHRTPVHEHRIGPERTESVINLRRADRSHFGAARVAFRIGGAIPNPLRGADNVRRHRRERNPAPDEHEHPGPRELHEFTSPARVPERSG